MGNLQAAGGKHLHRDSFGRFAADSKTGDNTSLGWNDFMTMASFTDPEQVSLYIVMHAEQVQSAAQHACAYGLCPV